MSSANFIVYQNSITASLTTRKVAEGKQGRKWSALDLEKWGDPFKEWMNSEKISCMAQESAIEIGSAITRVSL